MDSTLDAQRISKTEATLCQYRQEFMGQGGHGSMHQSMGRLALEADRTYHPSKSLQYMGCNFMCESALSLVFHSCPTCTSTTLRAVHEETPLFQGSHLQVASRSKNPDNAEMALATRHRQRSCTFANIRIGVKAGLEEKPLQSLKHT